MQYSSDAISAVNELIETLNERLAGYKKALELAEDAEAKNIFNKYIEQSAKFANELMTVSSDTNINNIGTGGLSAIFRGWVEIKAGITGKNTETIYQWCITGEETALKIYETIFATGLPKEAEPIAKKQYAAIQDSLVHLKSLGH